MVDSNKYTPNPRQFYKSNFVELLELLTPNMYSLDDKDLSGTTLNPLSVVINSHIDAANRIRSVLPLSSVPDSQTSNLSSIEGISQYFVKQNELTKVTTQSFREKILLPLSANYEDFDGSAGYKNYLSSNLLPKIVPPGIDTPGSIENNLTELSALTGDSAASSVHNYLVDNLGWFYFLNSSGTGALDYSPSSFVLDNLSRLYVGGQLETVDGVKGFSEYLWRNVEACSFGQYLPANFISGTEDAIVDPKEGEVATYTSGTQKLNNLKTLVDVIYSPLKIDDQDFTVKEAFDNFIDANLRLKDFVSDGPFRKFLTTLGFHFADISDQVESIKYIYDIENADQDKLRYIADLIGFKLRGNQSEKWRHQLRIATDIYKKAGTQQALRSALNAIIVNSVLDIDNKIVPLWESYLPFLIWYALGTESPLFKDLRTWTSEAAKKSGVVTYSVSSLEENIKLVTDSILLDLAIAYPKNFKYFGGSMPLPRFYYMNSDGSRGEFYTALGAPNMKPWHGHPVDGPGYLAFRRQAADFGEEALWDLATGPGPFGEGVYMVGEDHPKGLDRPTYLLFEGDPEFLFNYRGRRNFPLPPFEEIKYFRESVVTPDLVELLVDRLKCFKVNPQFARQVGDFLLESAVTAESNIGSLNEFLMFFSSVQHPPNYDDVMFRISDYEKNLLSLWNGKSSHFFIDFDNTDFDFRKVTLENDSKYALYETARVAQEYSPAHSIPKVNLNASAAEDYLASSTRFMFLGLDDDDTRAFYSSATVLGNAAISGVLFPTTVSPEGWSTFKRDEVDLDSIYNNFNPPPGTGTVFGRYIVAHDLSSHTRENYPGLEYIQKSKDIAQRKRDGRLQRPYEHIGSLDLSRKLSGGFLSEAWRLGPATNDPSYVDPSAGNPPFFSFRSTTQGNVNSYWESDSGDDFPEAASALGFSVSTTGEWGGVGANLQLENIRLFPSPVNWFRDQRQYWTRSTVGYGGMSSVQDLRNDTVVFPPYNGDNNQVIYSDQNFKGGESKNFTIRNFAGEMIVGLAKQSEYDPATLFANPVTESSGFYFGAKLDALGRVTDFVIDGDGLSSVSFDTGDGFNVPCNAIRFGVYKGNRFPYVATSQDNGVTWKLCGLGNRSVDKAGVPEGNPVERYHLLVKNLDAAGARITFTENPYAVEFGSITAGSQWTSNVYKASRNDPITGDESPYFHYYRPGTYIWRNVEVDGRNTNERPALWEPVQDILINPDMKWGTREFSLSGRTFIDCDWSHIKKEHCAYVATNGPVRVEGCTASSIGSQGLQVSYRSSPFQDYPTGDNSPWQRSTTHVIRDSHYVDCGFEGDRPAFTWTFFSPGNSQYPASIIIQDSTVVERFIRPIDDNSGDVNQGRSRKTFLVGGRQQGTSFDIFNVPDVEVALVGDLGTGSYPDQLKRVTSTSETYRWNDYLSSWENWGDITGNMTKQVKMQNTAIHTAKQGSTGHMSIRGVDDISFEHCAFIYDPEDPNWNVQDYKISIDSENMNTAGEGELNVSVTGTDPSACMQSRFLTLKNNIAVLPPDCPDARVIFRVFRTKARNTSEADNTPVFTFELDATNNLNRVIKWDLSGLDPSGGGDQTPLVLEDRAYDVGIDGPYPTAASGSGGVDTTSQPITDPPGKIQNAYPADTETGISLDVICSWSPTLNASGYDVYFGEGSLPGSPSVEDTTSTFFDPEVAIPGGLSYDTEYYWRVDTKNEIGTTTGDTLTFTTESAPPPAPGQATNFNPANGATNVSILQSCSWDEATNASSYDVYFGTDASPSIVSSEQVATSFDPGQLEYSTEYYWRIDPRGEGGVTTGSVLSFTTESDPGTPGSAPDEVTEGFPDEVEVTENPISLVWTAPGNDPSGFDVFFGTTPGSLTQIATDLANTRIDSPLLSGATTYYWDVTAKNSVGSTPMSSEFEFSTLGLPGEVSAGAPHQITVAPINTILTWQAASSTNTYKVFLSESVGDLFIAPVAEVQELAYNPGPLKQNTQYYWSIEAVNNFGSTSMSGGSSEGGEEGENPAIDPGTGYFSFLTSELPPSEILRRDLRRRNFRYLLPEFGYYDRTGFNGPISYDPSVLENSMASSLGELTLGYVASAAQFHPIDYRNVSGVWHICEGLESGNSFSGMDTSNTFPYRGLNELGSDAKRWDIDEETDRYVDRGQTPPVIRTMHSIVENRAKRFAELQISSNLSSYSDENHWKNQIQSYANSATASGYGINSFADYENFSFGREFQYLYANYAKDFGRHFLGKTVQEKTGANIFAHVFGKALFNCDFSLTGTNGAAFIQTSLRDSNPINASSVWGDGGLLLGTFTASSQEQAVVPLVGKYTSGSSFDYRNPTILSGIEFCDISGAPLRNQFAVIHLAPSAALPGQKQYLIDNPVIKCKAVGGLPRLRFDLSSYGDISNKLVPNHKFKLNVRALVGEENTNLLGGGQLGVWIHTEPSAGLMWSWTRDNQWRATDVSELSRDQVIGELCHVKDFVTKNSEDSNCLNAFGEDKGIINDLPLNNIRETDFEDFEIMFDTRDFTIHNNYEYRKIIDKNEGQYKKTAQVHEDRNHVVEVFFLPNNNYDKYLLIDRIELQDETLRYWAGASTGFGVSTSSIPLRPFVTEYKYEYNKQELADILGFYNTLVDGIASRDFENTSDVMGPLGGSRINYRVHPEWGSYVKDPTYDNYTEVEFIN